MGRTFRLRLPSAWIRGTAFPGRFTFNRSVAQNLAKSSSVGVLEIHRDTDVGLDLVKRAARDRMHWPSVPRLRSQSCPFDRYCGPRSSGSALPLENSLSPTVLGSKLLRSFGQSRCERCRPAEGEGEHRLVAFDNAPRNEIYGAHYQWLLT